MNYGGPLGVASSWTAGVFTGCLIRQCLPVHATVSAPFGSASCEKSALPYQAASRKTKKHQAQKAGHNVSASLAARGPKAKRAGPCRAGSSRVSQQGEVRVGSDEGEVLRVECTNYAGDVDERVRRGDQGSLIIQNEHAASQITR